MRGLRVAVLLLGLGAALGALGAAPELSLSDQDGLVGLLGLDLLPAEDRGRGDTLSALHRDYDKGWRHRAASAAAEDDEDTEEGDAGGAARPVEQPDGEQGKRRRYSRKRPRPPAEDADEAGPPKRRGKPDGKLDEPADEYRRVKKPALRRRRPSPADQAVEPAPAEDDARGNEPAASSAAPASSAVSPVDLKALLKQTAGQLSLSELLQNRNLSLADLLKGNRGALSALAAPAQPHDSATAHAERAHASSTAVSDSLSEPQTERHNSFVPSKPRRLPPVQRPATPPPSATPSREPEVTTSRPRRLPAVVARVKERNEQLNKASMAQQGDALDPMSPAMMAMITLEAADSHTSKPRRIPPPTAATAAPTTPVPTTTPAPSHSPSLGPSPTAGSTGPPPTRPVFPDKKGSELEGEAEDTAPPATAQPTDFNVDSLEITTPRLMGVKPSPSGKPLTWLPPAERIIDAQVFSPGAIAPSKLRPSGLAVSPPGPAGPGYPEGPPPTVSAPMPSPVTLHNAPDRFRLENETLELKEGSNALDKRKIASSPRPDRLDTSSTAQHTNELGRVDTKADAKAETRKPVVSTSSSTSSVVGIPRRLPPTLAGTRRLPAPGSRPKASTEATTPAAATTPERPRLPFLAAKGRLKDRERERDALLPPTRFALPLPEVISIEKMIADARSRGALNGTAGAALLGGEEADDDTPTTTTTTARTTTAAITSTTYTSRDEIVDLLKSEQSSTRLARILAERNMTLEDLLQHRERGSSQLHFADFFRNASAVGTAGAAPAADDTKPAIDLVPREIAPAERKETVDILRSFHEVPKYPFAYSGGDDSEEAASTLSLVNVKPAGVVLPADPGERYQLRGTAAPSRAPRVIPAQQQQQQPLPVPTYRVPEAHGGNPYLVIKHVSEQPERPDAVVLEHVGEVRQVGVSSGVEEAIVVDSGERVRDRDRPDRDRLDRLSLPNGVKSAIIASTVICGLAIVGFLTIFIVFRWRQKRALIRARGAILCEQLQRGSFRGRSLSPVLVNVSKSSQVQPMQASPGPVPYYSKKDLSSRATSNTASNRHYYLWRSLRKTFQEDDME